MRPILDAYLALYPAVQVRLLLLDRVVNLIDEGMDAAVRIGHLPDSGLIAIKTGEVRRVIAASPAYLRRHKPIQEPADLAAHDCICLSTLTPTDSWQFASAGQKNSLRTVRVRPRFAVNEAEAAVASAIGGRGVTCVLSYQIERELKHGQLKLILDTFAPPPLPVHVIYPEARLSAAKTRTFVEFVVPRLKKVLARISARIATAARRR